MNKELQSWTIKAVNLPEHADNPIHTDKGARAAGYPRAIVAGVSVYAYLTHPPAAAWGERWLVSGGGEVRFKQPVFDQDLVNCHVNLGDDRPTIEASVGDSVRATYALFESTDAPPMRDGECLPIREFVLDEDRADYGVRCGDDLPIYSRLGVAHPAMWPHVANRIFADHLVDGPWIHTRSRIYHQGLARVGDAMRVESIVVDRFDTRAGNRAIVDMAIFANGAPVVRVEHEALISLAMS